MNHLIAHVTADPEGALAQMAHESERAKSPFLHLVLAENHFPQQLCEGEPAVVQHLRVSQK